MRLRASLAVILTSLISLGTAVAQHTPACTDITNQATATYSVGSNVYTETSAPVTITVAELLDVSVVWQDAAYVPVSPGSSDQVLTFLVTNTGNGSDSYTLEGLSNLAGDDFDPVFAAIHLDSNGNGEFDPGVDAVYVPGANDPDLGADESAIVFALHDIPADLLDGDLGKSQLSATSTTGDGDPGTIVPEGGDCGTDAVVGTSGGSDSDTGTYVVSTAALSIQKSAEVIDPFGGSEPIPGAVIRYTIVVSVSGSEQAENVVITDPIPTHTTYSADTLALNGDSLTDELDGDAGDVGGTTANTVTVMLGDLSESSPVQSISFDVTID